MDLEPTVSTEVSVPEVKSVVFPMTGFRYQNMRTAADDWLKENRKNIDVVFSRYKIVLDDEAMTNHQIYKFILALEINYIEKDGSEGGSDESGSPDDEEDEEEEDDPKEPVPDSPPAVTDTSSFKDAISAASDGSEIKLAAGMSLSEKITVEKNVTLNLDGNTLTGDSSNGYLQVSGKDAHLTITGNGTISNKVGRALQVTNGATVTIGEGITVDSTFTAAIVLSGGNLCIDGGVITNSTNSGVQAQAKSTVTIRNGSVRGAAYAIKALSGSSIVVEGGMTGPLYISDTTNSGEGKITVRGTVDGGSSYGVSLFDKTKLIIEEGARITGACGITINGGAENKEAQIEINDATIEGSIAGIYLPNGTLNLIKGNITGGIGIMVRGGTLNVEGGTITGTNTGSLDIGDAKYTVPAAAIAIDKNASYSGGATNVTINGGTIVAPSENDNAISYTETGEVKDEIPDGISIKNATVTGKVFGKSYEEYQSTK